MGRSLWRAMGLFLCLSLFAIAGCKPRNVPPTASFVRTPDSGDAPLSVYFDASASTDVDGAIASYAWDFGDGRTGAGATLTHTYERAGAFAATLTVRDDGGGTAAATRVVDVRSPGDVPPVGAGVGERAPQISLPDVRTSAIRSLTEFRGLVVLLEFWRSTCAPCRTSLEHMETLRTRYAGEGFVVVTVSSDVTAVDARDYLDGHGYSEFIGLHDGQGVARALFGVSEVPHAFLLDRQGIVRRVDHPIRFRDRDITPWL